jgi:hypothetical protein
MIISHNNGKLPLEFSFPLKNGYSKVFINNNNCRICYYDHNDNLIQEFQFSKHNIKHVDSEFSNILKQLILLDRSSKQPERHDVVLSPTHGGS